jgi:hypothetical protein
MDRGHYVLTTTFERFRTKQNATAIIWMWNWIFRRTRENLYLPQDDTRRAGAVFGVGERVTTQVPHATGKGEPAHPRKDVGGEW